MSLLYLSETGQELMCKHSKDGMPANSTERLPHAETQKGHYPSGPKGQCIKRMLSNSYLKLLAIRRALKGPKLKSPWSSCRLGLSGPSLTVAAAPHKLKSPWSSCRLGLSGPSLTVAAAPHIIAGTRPKRARTSAGSRPKWARAKWARACIFSNLSQFCSSKSLQGGGRDARKATAARALNNARTRSTRNSYNI